MVEVGEDLVDEDGICNLGGMKQVHLQEAGLQVCFLWLVVLERLQEEGCSRLDHVLGHENIDNLRMEGISIYVTDEYAW